MSNQQKVVLESASKIDVFIPAFHVKNNRKFHCEYRKRCQELVKLKLLKSLGLKYIDGANYGTFQITKLGVNQLKKTMGDSQALSQEL